MSIENDKCVECKQGIKNILKDMLERAKRKQLMYPEKYCGSHTTLAHIRWVEDLEELQRMLDKQ